MIVTEKSRVREELTMLRGMQKCLSKMASEQRTEFMKGHK